MGVSDKVRSFVDRINGAKKLQKIAEALLSSEITIDEIVELLSRKRVFIEFLIIFLANFMPIYLFTYNLYFALYMAVQNAIFILKRQDLQSMIQQKLINKAVISDLLQKAYDSLMEALAKLSPEQRKKIDNAIKQAITKY